MIKNDTIITLIDSLDKQVVLKNFKLYQINYTFDCGYGTNNCVLGKMI